MQISNFLHRGIVCAILFPLFLNNVQAQQTGSTISGIVRSGSGEGLPGISILLKPGTNGVATSSDGQFELKNLTPGNYTIEVSAIGYLKISETISVKKNQTLSKNFTLKEDEKELQEVRVFGKTEAQQVKEQAFTVNAIQTKQFANTTADLNQILNRSTGVRIREQGGTGSDFNFSINGLSGKAVKFFIDGVPMESMGTSMTLNNIPVNLAERVEVYKGVVPVHLGSDALGGAVNVITNQSVGKYLDASYSYGSFNTHRAALTTQYRDAGSGLVLRTSGFYNYSNNNYLMRGVEVYDETQKKYVAKNFKRFHDQFQSIMGQLEAGFMDKKWADVFFVGASYTAQDKDLQTGSTQKIVYGNVTQDGHALSTTLRYRKDDLLLKGLNFNLFAAHVWDTYQVVDTTYKKYAWDGTYIESNRAEISGGERSIRNFSRPKTLLRANASYKINGIHSLNINYTIDRFKNKLYDKAIVGDTTNDLMTRQILGVAYQQSIWNDRLANTFFGKYYGMAMQVNQAGNYLNGDKADANGTTTNFGYGIASRLKISDNIGIKASYEYAYRLQSADEMLGNGSTVISNFSLKPENGNNVNIGAYWGKHLTGRHRLFAEGSWFYRDVKDFIYTVVLEALGVSQYQNTSNVKVTGMEGEVKYSYNNLLEVTVNGSYQNAINTTKNDDRGVPEITYLNRVPNQPWIFANADFNIGKNDLLGKNTRLQFNWYTQYVHWFYLTWEAFGNKQTKPIIPDQYLHNAVVTYSRDNGRYNISLECRNLTNNLAYDNFRLQKPGRAFNVKLRYFLK